MPVSRLSVLCNWVWQAGVHAGFRTITLVPYIGSLPNLATWFPVEGEEPYLFWGQRSRSPLLSIEFLTTGSFLHDNFSSVYWNFTKLGHMIPLWKGKKPIYFGVITIIPFDNLYDGRILWCTHFLFSYIMMGWIFIVLVHWNNNLLVDIPIHSDSFSRLWVNQSLLLLLNSVCLEE